MMKIPTKCSGILGFCLCALTFGVFAFGQTVVDPCPSTPGACRLALPTTGAYLGILSEFGLTAREGPMPPAGLGIDRVFASHLTSAQWTDIEGWWDPTTGDLTPSGEKAIGSDLSVNPWRFPVINWACDQTASTNGTDYLIASGDTGELDVIRKTARSLKRYPHPVMLRWYWEFNDYGKNGNCLGPVATGQMTLANAQTYFIRAWRRIWTIFQNEGATNVMFSWSPDIYTMESGEHDPHGFYPGNPYVDWIGVDIFPRTWPTTFDYRFELFYSDFSQIQYGGKPLMVGANGALNDSTDNTEYQYGYLASLLEAAPSYPLLKAYAYFDSHGTTAEGVTWDWELDGNDLSSCSTQESGLCKMATLGASPQFNAIPEWCSVSLEQTASPPVVKVAVMTTPNCPWSVGPLPNWIATTGDAGAGGVGPGSVTFVNLTNSPHPAQTATIEIGGVSIPLHFPAVKLPILRGQPE